MPGEQSKGVLVYKEGKGDVHGETSNSHSWTSKRWEIDDF